MSEQKKQLHPRMLMMWMAMASMFMVFAGLTSAFILQKGTRADWQNLQLPWAFWPSTLAIILSSFTMHKAVQLFKDKQRKSYSQYIIFTLILGIIFLALQVQGFYTLLNQGVTLERSASGGFLYIIAGLHITHLIGAIVALVIVYLLTFRKSIKVYSVTDHKIMATFWHFVDGLWVYLFLFF